MSEKTENESLEARREQQNQRVQFLAPTSEALGEPSQTCSMKMNLKPGNVILHVGKTWYKNVFFLLSHSSVQT